MDHLDKYCWEETGVRGDRSCERLDEVIHCRFCDVFKRNSTAQLTGEALEDYLLSMYERMNEESDNAQRGVAHVVFELGKQLFGIPVEAVRGILKKSRIHSVPGRSGQKFLGMVNIDGSLELCFSLHRILNQSIETDRAVFIDVLERDQSWVFPVTEVVGIYRFQPEEFTPAPEFELSLGTAQHNQQPVTILDVGKLILAAEESLS